MSNLQNNNKYYWLKEDGGYILVEIFARFPMRIYRGLPTVSRKHEDILKQNNIKYIQSGDFLEVYDPLFVEYEEVTAKVCKWSEYSFENGQNVLFLDETHTESMPTEGMIRAAKTYSEYVEHIIEQAKFDMYFKETTVDGLCIIWERSKNALNITMSEMDRNKYYVLELLRRNTYHGEVGLVISKEAIGDKNAITLNVPKHYVGLVVGRSGANVRRMAYELALKYITVIASQD